MLQILPTRLIQAKFRHETELLLSSVTQDKSHHSNALSYTHIQRNGFDAVALVALIPKRFCSPPLPKESPIIQTHLHKHTSSEMDLTLQHSQYGFIYWKNRDQGSIFSHEIRLRSCWRPLLLQSSPISPPKRKEDTKQHSIRRLLTSLFFFFI